MRIRVGALGAIKRCLGRWASCLQRQHTHRNLYAGSLMRVNTISMRNTS